MQVSAHVVAPGRRVLVNGDLQARSVADLLQLEIVPDELELPREGHVVLTAGLDDVAQQLAELRERPRRQLRVRPADEAGDGVERIEQKVRLQLRAQQP
jgi:hypothetical protein